MLHWTILNENDVFANSLENTIAPSIEIKRGQAILLVQSRKDGTGSIERLISPLASDYLRPELQPGCIVSLQNVAANS